MMENMASEKISKYELNFSRYLLSVNKLKRCSYEYCCNLLFQVLSEGTEHDTLQEFCVNALGCRKEQLANIFNGVFLESIKNGQVISSQDFSLESYGPRLNSIDTPNCQKPPVVSVPTPNVTNQNLNSCITSQFSESTSVCCIHGPSSRANYRHTLPYIMNYSTNRASHPGYNRSISEPCKSNSKFINLPPNQINGQNILRYKPHAANLPDSALLLLLKEVFPHLPHIISDIIEYLENSKYFVCHVDVQFDDTHTASRVDKISHLALDLFDLISDHCNSLLKSKIQNIQKDYKVIRTQYTKLKRDYQKYMTHVNKSREDLQIAERELLVAAEQNEKFKVEISDYSMSTHQDFQNKTKENESVQCSFEDMSRSIDSLVPPTRQDVSLYSVACDSGTFSLAVDDGEGKGFSQDSNLNNITLPNHEESLLSSVMFEYRVIQRKHSLMEHDRKIGGLLRSSRRSIIFNRKEVRDCLHTNISAEENALTKEDLLQQCKTEGKKLIEEMRILKKQYNNIAEEKTTFENQLLEITYESLSLSDSEILINNINKVRSSDRGKVIMAARPHTLYSSIQTKNLNLHTWLQNQKEGEFKVKKLYSTLKNNRNNEIVHIEDYLKIRKTKPSVITISGPMGCGKTSLCEYIHHLYKNIEEEAVSDFDFVVYGTLSHIIALGSWESFLREYIFWETLKDYDSSQVFQVLMSLNVLFLLDTGLWDDSFRGVIKQVFTHLGNNKVIITVRTGREETVHQLAAEHEFHSIQIEMCPMSEKSIQNYALDFFSLAKSVNEVTHEDETNKFLKTFLSRSPSQLLLHPLPLSYLMFLWNCDHSHIIRANTLAQVFIQVVVVCQYNMCRVFEERLKCSRDQARSQVELWTERFFKAAWEFMHKNENTEQSVFLDDKNELFSDMTLLQTFYPFITIKIGKDGKLCGYLTHQAVCEALCGFYLADVFANTKTSNKLISKSNSILTKLAKGNSKKYRDMTPFLAGFLQDSNYLNSRDAKSIALFYQQTLEDKHEMDAFLFLLKECCYSKHMRKAVADIFSPKVTWNVINHNNKENFVVSELLTCDAYRPATVIIINSDLHKNLEDSITAICQSLSTCNDTLVEITLETQFYGWDIAETSDHLVLPLQPPGTITKFWGHLSEHGALALRHMKRMKELYVRISSIKAMNALTYSLSHMHTSLQYLYLRLDISTETSPSALNPILFSGKKIWLRMQGITDTSASWLLEVSKRLSNKYTEVILDDSNLSPSTFQMLKESLPVKMSKSGR